jgi:hypothetical protein
MALKLVANYSKKLGLPQYSSHSFGVSLEVELTDVSQVEEECSRLYQVLQTSVDREIQNVGFIPSAPGNNGHHQQSNGSHHQNGTHTSNGNGDQPWNCTTGQKSLILKILHENNIEKQEAQNLAMQLFNLPVPDLNKMQASQLIEDLLVKAGKPAPRRWSRTTTTRQTQ